MNIPNPVTTLFGRDDELVQIAHHLDDPNHRLVTLVGPGGIGKTRLGLEASRRYGELTKDGAVFVDLQAVDDPSRVTLELAGSLQLTVQDQEKAPAQIARFLADKETLLFFDNFEQVADAAPFIGQLLQESPGTTALVTSRVPLRLTQEWLLHVDGLPVPQANRPRVDDYPAFLLFVDRARQVRPDLLVEQQRPAIERICRLTEGMPLAIEIAASWASVLDCEEIAAEIGNSRQFLTSVMRDVPERHRSIQAVFDQTMQMVEVDEQQVFGRLSIFHGGFSRDAAEKVTGADLSTLSSLVDRSLIRSADAGRFHIHELVRQFAADQLALNEEGRSSVEASHSVYYMDLMADLHDAMSVSDQLNAIAQLDPDRQNVRVSWQFAVRNHHAEQVAAATVTLAQFIQYRGQYANGGTIFAEAVGKFKEAEQTPAIRRALALMLIQHGWFNLRQGRLDASEAAFRESAELHSALGMKPIRGFAMDPDLGLAYVASTRGDVETATELCSQVLTNAETDGNTQHWGMANQLLGHLALRNGQVALARRHDEAALKASEQLGEYWFTSYCHNELGEVNVAEGNYEEASVHFAKSLKVSEEFGDRANSGLSLVYLGEVAMLAGEMEEAQRYFGESKVAYELLGDRGGIARATAGLGQLATKSGQFGAACQQLEKSLDSATEMRFAAMVMDVLCATGELALEAGLADEAQNLIAYVAEHSSTESRTRARIRTLGDRVNHGSAFAGLLEDQVDLARQVLAKVWRSSSSETAHEASSDLIARSARMLPEPLTEREIEVLGKIARGLPNKQIAEELIVSLGTVKWHSNQIYTKLGVHNRTSAVVKAQDLGILAGEF